MPGKTPDHPPGAILEALVGERRQMWRRPRLGFAHGEDAHAGAEHQPVGDTLLVRIRRPGEAPAADHSAVDHDGIRPSHLHRFFRRREGRKGVDERAHPRAEHPPREPQRLLGLQHQREFDTIEAADIDQRARPFAGRDGAGMAEGIASLAQLHRAIAGRQIEAETVIGAVFRHSAHDHGSDKGELPAAGGVSFSLLQL